MPERLRLAVTSDLHLDEGGPWKHRPIRGDAAYACRQVAQWCEENHPENVVILGDMVDRPTPRAAGVTLLLDLIDRLWAAGCAVHYVLGNHEGYQDWASLRGGADHIHGQSLALGPLCAYGLDYLPPGRIEPALEAIPAGVDILLTHQPWRDLVGGSGTVRLAQVPAHVSTVISGDFHGHGCYEFEPGRMLYSPGSTHATDLSEDYTHAFYAFYVRDGVLVPETIPLKGRPIYRLTADTEAELVTLIGGLPTLAAGAQIMTMIPEEVRVPIVEVTYSAGLPDAHRRLRAALEGWAHAFLVVRPAEAALASGDLSAAPLLSLDEAIAAEAPADSPAGTWALRLLHSADFRAEWAAIKQEFLHHEAPQAHAPQRLPVSSARP